MQIKNDTSHNGLTSEKLRACPSIYLKNSFFIDNTHFNRVNVSDSA